MSIPQKNIRLIYKLYFPFLQEKLISHTLGLFDDDATHTSLVAEGWCPTRLKLQAENALRKAQVIIIQNFLSELNRIIIILSVNHY